MPRQPVGPANAISDATASAPGATLLARSLLGLPVAAVLAYATVGFIARAWDACDDAEPPYLFGLTLFVMPMIGFAQWIGWVVVAAILRSRPWRLFIPAALVGVLLVGWAAAAMEVPAHETSFYAADAADPADDSHLSPMHCRADGIPAWWPEWLPL
jgi:hypothetical protein